MKKVAVVLTVYNRRETTLEGLSSLFCAISHFSKDYHFDTFMTDDGCTDGTKEAVIKQHPNVVIITGNGSLFWTGGMNKAWKVACQQDNYDYYVWFNDDALLQINAFDLLFKPIESIGDRVIVSGAFKDNQGNVSYGGRDKRKKLIIPNGSVQPVLFMNGNLTLVPAKVAKEIGFIDEQFIHIGGDWDYGLRAQKKGIPVVLTSDYVGITDRHDKDAYTGNLIARFHTLYSKKHDPIISFKFYLRHFGFFRAAYEFLKRHITIVYPDILKK